MNFLHLNEGSKAETPERIQAFNNRVYRITYLLGDMEMHDTADRAANSSRVSSTGNLGATTVSYNTELAEEGPSQEAAPIAYEPNPLFSNNVVPAREIEISPVNLDSPVVEDSAPPVLDPQAALANALAIHDNPNPERFNQTGAN